MKAAFLLGRLIFGGFFLYNGIHHLRERKMLSQYAASRNVPLAEIAVTATGAMLLAGGASILLGIKPKLGALAIIGFLVGVSPTMHDFWNLQDPGQRMNEMVNFSKNMALLGGAVALLGVEEPWPASLASGKTEAPERVRRFAREQLAA